VNDWTPNMVGTHAKPKCKTKGAETWSLLLFLVDELNRLQSRAGEHSQRLRQAGQCLIDMVLLWRRSSWTVPAEVVEDARAKLHPPSLANKKKIHIHCTTKHTTHTHTLSHTYDDVSKSRVQYKSCIFLFAIDVGCSCVPVWHTMQSGVTCKHI
jgi:hypothetical protein